MSDATPEDLTFRNLFRQHVLEVAEDLEMGRLNIDDAAEKLKELCDADIRDMDEGDIEVDFDMNDAEAGPLLALGALAGAGAEISGAPHEVALTRVIRIRDRINGLKIVASVPGEADLASYNASLRDLLDALKTANLG